MKRALWVPTIRCSRSRRRAVFRVVIPARFGSARLPGKPLLLLAGKAMIQWVYERARRSGAQQVIVATDDDRIAQRVGIVGYRATVALDELRGTTVQGHGTPVVAEPRPCTNQLRRPGSGGGLRVREAGEEALVGADHASDLGLLEHDLAHQDRPRFARPAPRQVAPLSRTECEHGAAQRAEGPGARLVSPRRRRRGGDGAARRRASTPSPSGGSSRLLRRAG